MSKLIVNSIVVSYFRNCEVCWNNFCQLPIFYSLAAVYNVEENIMQLTNHKRKKTEHAF